MYRYKCVQNIDYLIILKIIHVNYMQISAFPLYDFFLRKWGRLFEGGGRLFDITA